jgi:hypothetical protein
MAYTTINKPQDHFNTKLYSGNSSTNAITGVGFQPDLVWLKRRTVAVAHHLWHDVVRGKSGDKYYYLESSSTIAQNVQGDADGLSTLDSDGFTLTYNDSGAWNVSGSNYVSWNFKAGSTPSNNTDGSITSSVSANTTAGFSIVNWTSNGADSTTNVIGHGLGVAPKVTIYKPLSTTGDWYVWLNGVIDGSQDYLKLNTTDTKSDLSSAATPTSTLISNFGFGNAVNMIAYCFAEKTGYSKFGTYTGNGSANGPFVYCGFKPAWIMFRETGNTNSWRVTDSVRDTYNPKEKSLNANSTSTEANSGYTHDALSNGFKVRTTDTNLNRSGGTYFYMAFAEAPIVGTNNVPANAR